MRYNDIVIKASQAFVLILLLTACEKEVDIDYHEVNPLYVVEGAVTELRTTVHVSRTRSMNATDDTDDAVDNALVVVSTPDGKRDTATYGNRGNYVATTKGVAGQAYRLDVYVDGQQFTSTSVMQQKPVLNNFRMVWKEMFSTRILFGELLIQDFVGEENFYYVHVFRNGFSYRWTVFSDRGSAGKEIKQLFTCCTEDDIDDSDSTISDTDVIWEGDDITIEIRAIDRRSYDYLSSMQTMSSAGTNPIANFTGGCLGYFSAYSPTTYYYEFHKADVEEEDE